MRIELRNDCKLAKDGLLRPKVSAYLNRDRTLNVNKHPDIPQKTTSKNKPRLIILVIFVAIVAWLFCYYSINRYYSSFSDITKEIYAAGENVAFGDNYQNKGLNANGYEICVDHFEILDYADYVEEIGFELHKNRSTPEKVALVYISLFNVDSTENGVMLTEFALHGIDNYVGLNRELLDALNPGLQGNAGIHLAIGEQYRLIIPYNLYKIHFATNTWKNLNSYKFYLHITSFPVEIDIKVN